MTETLNEFFNYNGPNYTDEFATSLKQCEDKVIKRSNDPDVGYFFKPIIKGSRKRRQCKEKIYKLAGDLARQNQLSGNMISLGAAYALEIMKEFHGVITDRFINCERDNLSYFKLSRYYYELLHGLNLTKIEDKSDLNKVFLRREDIFHTLMGGQVKDLAVIDLDLMQRLDTSLIDKIYSSLEVPGLHKDRFLLAVWSTYGRSCTENDYDTKSRPYLLYRFVFDKQSRYELTDYRTYKYCDNHIPLKVELLILETKKNNDSP